MAKRSIVRAASGCLGHAYGTHRKCFKLRLQRAGGSTLMPALFPIILTATQIVLVVDSVPKFDVERTCRAAQYVSCLLDEKDARSKLEKDCRKYSAAQRNQ